MPHINTTLSIQGQAGNIQACLHIPDNGNKTLTGLALILHPHPLFGGTMDNKVVQTLIKSTNDLNYAAMRFNFRGVGQSDGVHDNGIAETSDTMEVLKYMRSTLIQELHKQNYAIDHNCPIILGGFSFGTFVISNLLDKIDFKPKKILMVGTAAGKWDVKGVPSDSLIIHGEDDDVIPLDYAMTWAKKYQLSITIVPNAGHFFHGKLVLLKNLVKQSLSYNWD